MEFKVESVKFSEDMTLGYKAYFHAFANAHGMFSSNQSN